VAVFVGFAAVKSTGILTFSRLAALRYRATEAVIRAVAYGTGQPAG
jgi:hypothetical protein